MTNNQPYNPRHGDAFRAPGWAGDWCAKCDWAQTCTDCRAGWIG